MLNPETYDQLYTMHGVTMIFWYAAPILREEEDEALPDFRKHASLELRERLGVEWIRFKAEHAAGQGVSDHPVDVEGYLKRTGP